MITNKHISKKDVVELAFSSNGYANDHALILDALDFVFKRKDVLTWKTFSNSLQSFANKRCKADYSTLASLCFIVGAETVEGPN